MAKLTPLAKGLITLVVIGGTAAAAWHLGLRELVQSRSATPATSTSTPTPPSTSTSSRPATSPVATTKPGNGPLGSANNPLKVSLVSFHGYAPALLANGKSLKTQAGSIYDRLGVNVEFLIQDDIPTLTTIFESNTAQCAWRTSDFWAQEQPNLRNSGHDGRAIIVVDNTQGGDAIITRDPAIRRVEDLAGRTVALLQFTPSDGMTIDAIENSSMTARAKNSVRYVYINAEEGTAGVRAAFAAGNVDAAALWDPDLSLALKNVPGAHVVYSTRTATNLIYDVIVCDSRVLDNPANTNTFQAFVAGWLEGVEVARKAPDDAVDALVRTEEFFTLLAKDQGRDFVKSLFQNLVWTGLEDNARILGLVGGTNHYERVYRRFDGIYRRAGALANPNSPVIAPQDSFDTRFVSKLLAKSQAAQQAAAQPEYTFSEREREQMSQQPASVTKPVTVTFATASAELTKRAQKTLDDEMVPFIENNGSAYFEISGNTDSTGSREVNMRLSRARAQAVVDYLVTQWEFERARFRIVGNGPDRPICNEASPQSENLTLEECRALNRSTRAAVLAR
ncbi:MAG TPA: phosphate ABC transporter substrate-binding/OmpA family protein [Dokdonella sp.]|uniref:phosphate ABC transporter substrate-binding/OmpA family protein n=1 Tax=Dokdonella sp. TaxID=2291710 RepID=UPI0025BB5F74|nr:phosphate ABC transporter substrate-binding/OmpA family protein [Dokdonella sp.]MBX3692185.1 OmpA family protein [Dokdonella sp.]HNR91618.1 phosphate ABC transporter substrate-binding/OmpA family protein [Dokdonella sp.]